MSEWKTSTCERCRCPYDSKENAMGALGGHSPDQCIAALREKVEHQDKFCQEFIWGEDCPHEYETLSKKVEDLESDLIFANNQRTSAQDNYRAICQAREQVVQGAMGLADGWYRNILKKLITQAGKVVQEAKHHEGHEGIRLLQERVLADLEDISNQAVEFLKENECE